MKRLFKSMSVIMLVFVLLVSLIGCGEKKSLVDKINDGDIINIDIIKYVAAGPLDLAEEGIIKELEQNGFKDGVNVKITKHNCMGQSDLVNSIVKSVVEESDMIFAIATPVAATLAMTLKNQGLEIPSFFTAITDPVDAGIVSDYNNVGGSITGTSDLNPVEIQIKLAKELVADCKKVGFIYSLNESNSVVQLDLAKKACQEIGIELVSVGTQTTTDFQSAVVSMINSNVDCVYLPTDSNLSSSSKTVLDELNLNKIPTIAGDSTFLDNGATITIGSVDYFELGKLTGKMAASVLKLEKKVNEIAVGYYKSEELEINVTKANEVGIKINEELLNKADKKR